MIHTLIVLTLSAVVAFIPAVYCYSRSRDPSFSSWWDAEGMPIFGISLIAVVLFDFWVGWL